MLTPSEEVGLVNIPPYDVRHRRLVATMSVSQSDLVAFIATRDATRARAFYESTLGLRVLADTPFALVFDARGTTIRIQKVETFAPHPFTALGWRVADIAATVDELRGRGVVFERYDSFSQDAKGIARSGEDNPGPSIAWFTDPAGNILSVLSG